MVFVINDPLLGIPRVPVSQSYATNQPWTIGSYKFGENNLAFNYEVKADDPYLGFGKFVWAQATAANTAGATISSIVYSATPTATNQFVATVTTASAHSLVPGTKVILTGVVPAAYNGTYLVLTTPSTTTFTIAVAGVTTNATTVGTYSYGTIRPGAFIALTPTISSGFALTTAPLWDGTVNTGRPLAIAASGMLVNEYGWFQVQGNAIANMQAVSAAGAPLYYVANGYGSTSAVISKQVVNAITTSTIGATIGTSGANDSVTLPSATTTSSQALVYLNYPFAQGAIT